MTRALVGAVWLWGSILVAGLFAAEQPAEPFAVQLRSRVETAPDTGRYHVLTRGKAWDPRTTAVIVCDVWDAHHCWNAVRRVVEMAPRLNQVLQTCRDRGAVIIHAPSECMPAYADHPARRRAQSVPLSGQLPADIRTWCRRIPAEEKGVYPIDQTDGGEDDDPQEHAAWAARLTALGRNPKLPWKQQSDLITIDPERDYITDQGAEVWSILEQRGIEHVILTGVHTNMCVLGRPFGLRQLVKNGRQAVLMRDMTDTMYNPARSPYVSHFTGTDLIVEHIEKFVCPTISSDQVVGGTAFRFRNDRRPHVVCVMAEDEYHTETSLPEFAAAELGRDFRVTHVFGSETARDEIPGLEVLADADALILSVRRRQLPERQLNLVRAYVAAGKPVIGIRTASHAFSKRNDSPESSSPGWPEFDAEVFGGNYRNHHAVGAAVQIERVEPTSLLLDGIPGGFSSTASLYQVSPLAAGTMPLLMGRIEGQPVEPIAWTFTRTSGGRSFYTSLGGPDDFKKPEFRQLLVNAVAWACGVTCTRPAPSPASARVDR